MFHATFARSYRHNWWVVDGNDRWANGYSTGYNRRSVLSCPGTSSDPQAPPRSLMYAGAINWVPESGHLAERNFAELLTNLFNNGPLRGNIFSRIMTQPVAFRTPSVAPFTIEIAPGEPVSGFNTVTLPNSIHDNIRNCPWNLPFQPVLQPDGSMGVNHRIPRPPDRP